MQRLSSLTNPARNVWPRHTCEASASNNSRVKVHPCVERSADLPHVRESRFIDDYPLTIAFLVKSDVSAVTLKKIPLSLPNVPKSHPLSLPNGNYACQSNSPSSSAGRNWQKYTSSGSILSTHLQYYSTGTRRGHCSSISLS